jgi:hypothetical protein
MHPFSPGQPLLRSRSNVANGLGPVRQDARDMGTRAGGDGLGALIASSSAMRSRARRRRRSTSAKRRKASAVISSISPSRCCAR